MQPMLQEGGFRPIALRQPLYQVVEGSQPAVGGPDEQKWLRGLLNARAARGKFFNPELFSDPAWDILLELYSAELAQRRISISGLIRATRVPATTILRWISALQKDDLVARSPDPIDGRRVYIALTAAGVSALKGYFASLSSTHYPFGK